MTGFRIINSYSTKGPSNNTHSVPSDIIIPSLPGPTLTLGELNIHHLSADSLRSLKEDEMAPSVPYMDRATELGYTLLNTPPVYTWFSMSLVGRLGVLDLAFACPLLGSWFSEWSDGLRRPGPTTFPSNAVSRRYCFEPPLPSQTGPCQTGPTLKTLLSA